MAVITFYAGNTATLYQGDANYDTAWGSANADSTSNNTAMVLRDVSSYNVDRGFFYFNTSSIDDAATITSATLKLYATAKSGTKTCRVTLSSSTNTTYANADYSKYNSGTNFGSKTVADISTSAWNSFTVSSPNTTISKTGNTQLAVWLDYGFGDWANVTFSGSNDATYKPQLEVTYNLPGGFFSIL